MRAHALLTTVTAGALVLAGAGVAHAEGTSAADAVARDVAQVAPSVDVQDGDSSVTTLPADTAGAVELATSNGTLHLGLPGQRAGQWGSLQQTALSSTPTLPSQLTWQRRH